MEADIVYIKNEAGFTLIEVLISVLVLAIGLLGLAGLQATGLKNNASAYHRTQATLLAYDIADRMRANRVEAKKYATSTYKTIDPDSASYQASCLSTTGCSPSALAQNDLFEWHCAIAGCSAENGPPAKDAMLATLPLGQATISVVEPIYTIRINWDDNGDGSVDNNDPNFQMSFQL